MTMSNSEARKRATPDPDPHAADWITARDAKVAAEATERERDAWREEVRQQIVMRDGQYDRRKIAEAERDIFRAQIEAVRALCSDARRSAGGPFVAKVDVLSIERALDQAPVTTAHDAQLAIETLRRMADMLKSPRADERAMLHSDIRTWLNQCADEIERAGRAGGGS